MYMQIIKMNNFCRIFLLVGLLLVVIPTVLRYAALACDRLLVVEVVEVVWVFV